MSADVIVAAVAPSLTIVVAAALQELKARRRHRRLEVEVRSLRQRFDRWSHLP